MSKDKILPPVTCKLLGVDGNAFVLMTHWQRCARQAGWPEKDIKQVLDDAMSGDYQHLLCVLADHCENPMSDSEEDGEE